MAKVEIDNKKLWESLRKAMWYFPEAEWLTRSIDTALSEQGLTVNDKGEITTIEPEPKKCLFTKEEFTDKERKELCEGCHEECELNKNIPMFKEVERNGKNELTDFESEIAHILVYVNNEPTDTDKERKAAYQKYAKNARFFAPLLLDKARKLITSEIDATQMTREMSIKDLYSLTLGAAYYQGIVNTIKKIKGESV